MKLDPYQEQAREFAVSQDDAAALFLGCGLGKTAISIRYIESLFANLESKGVLIVAPRRPALVVWPLELEKWAPWIKYEVLRGPTMAEQLRKPAHVYIVNYEILHYCPRTTVSQNIKRLSRLIQRMDEAQFRKAKKWIDRIVQRFPLEGFAETKAAKLVKSRRAMKGYVRELLEVAEKEAERGLVPALKKIPTKCWPFDQIIWDELTWMKNENSSRVKHATPIVARMDKCVGLTGTIITKNYMDLWAQFLCLDGGKRLGNNFYKFRQQHFYLPDPYHKYDWHMLPGAKEKIEAAVADISLTMESADHLDIPPCTFETVELELPAKLQAQYKELEKEFLLDLDEVEIEAVNRAVLCGKLLQFSAGSIYFEDMEELERLKAKGLIPKKVPRGTKHIHDIKLKAAKKIIDRHKAAGEPILVAYGYQHEAERFLERFPEAVHLKSGLSQKKELELQARWDRGEIPIILCHPASAGHGLNMQYGSHVALWLTPTYDYDLDHQFNKRIDRRGQVHPTTIYRLVMRGTIDEAVLSCIETKAETRDEFVKVMKKYRESTLQT